jgi:hypothetical protein
MADPQQRLPVPNRRREDPVLAQILATVELTRATVVSMDGRVRVLEREMGESRRIREAIKVDDMSLDQKEAFIEMAEWWLKTKENPTVARTEQEKWVRWSTIFQAIQAGILLGITVFLLLRR